MLAKEEIANKVLFSLGGPGFYSADLLEDKLSSFYPLSVDLLFRLFMEERLDETLLPDYCGGCNLSYRSIMLDTSYHYMLDYLILNFGAV